MNKNNSRPFGLLFEEPENSVLEVVLPVYDETEDIAVIIDDRGNKIPYVEWYGLVGTKTDTRIAGEGADEDDVAPKTLGTRTLTEVKKEEASDFDDMSYLLDSGENVTETLRISRFSTGFRQHSNKRDERVSFRKQ